MWPRPARKKGIVRWPQAAPVRKKEEGGALARKRRGRSRKEEKEPAAAASHAGKGGGGGAAQGRGARWSEGAERGCGGFGTAAEGGRRLSERGEQCGRVERHAEIAAEGVA